MAQRLTPAQIAAAARARGYDPQAILAVASREGLGGGIGDGGHAYGPFQLNNAGGVISQQYGGRVNDQAVQDWAWSPQGVKFALDRMSFAKGLKGPDAIAAIVNRFERPANPGREIAGANAAYGNLPAAAAAAAAPAPMPGSATQSTLTAAAAPPPNFRPQLAQQLAAAAGSPTNDLTSFYSTLHQALQARAAAQQRSTATPSGPVTRQPASTSTPTIPVGATGIAKTALTQLGTPYQWGGAAKLGSRTDCSGLLQASARANGIKLGRTTYEQFKQGSPVPIDQLAAGDAVFFHMGDRGPEHVAIYIGNGKVVEDPHTGAVVSISELHGRKGLVGARRYG